MPGCRRPAAPRGARRAPAALLRPGRPRGRFRPRRPLREAGDRRPGAGTGGRRRAGTPAPSVCEPGPGVIFRARQWTASWVGRTPGAGGRRAGGITAFSPPHLGCTAVPLGRGLAGRGRRKEGLRGAVACPAVQGVFRYGTHGLEGAEHGVMGTRVVSGDSDHRLQPLPRKLTATALVLSWE